MYTYTCLVAYNNLIQYFINKYCYMEYNNLLIINKSRRKLTTKCLDALITF